MVEDKGLLKAFGKAHNQQRVEAINRKYNWIELNPIPACNLATNKKRRNGKTEKRE